MFWDAEHQYQHPPSSFERTVADYFNRIVKDEFMNGPNRSIWPRHVCGDVVGIGARSLPRCVASHI